MVREAARRGLILVAGSLALGDAAVRADASCAGVTIPAELALSCVPAADGVAIAPQGGTFAALSRMTIRPLGKDGPDAGAWTHPPAWLRSQITPNLAGLADIVSPLADDPDSPLADGQAKQAVAAFRRALEGLATLPLAACDEPAPTGADEWSMRCDFASDGIGLHMALRLVVQDDRRWAITMRSASEQRLRHFEAIANSFQPS